jgi:hypothetical protein
LAGPILQIAGNQEGDGGFLVKGMKQSRDAFSIPPEETKPSNPKAREVSSLLLPSLVGPEVGKHELSDRFP